MDHRRFVGVGIEQQRCIGGAAGKIHIGDAGQRLETERCLDVPAQRRRRAHPDRRDDDAGILLVEAEVTDIAHLDAVEIDRPADRKAGDRPVEDHLHRQGARPFGATSQPVDENETDDQRREDERTDGNVVRAGFHAFSVPAHTRRSARSPLK